MLKIFSVHFIKNLILKNLEFRYEYNPQIIKEYTIHSSNYTKIIDFLSKIDTHSQFKDEILKPVFSKGIDRLFLLIDLIDKTFRHTGLNFKLFLIAQFIILNQVFGDGNHRTAIYVLKKYSSYSTIEIGHIIEFTEEIHSYKGSLHNAQIWEKRDGFLYPDIHKLLFNKSVGELIRQSYRIN